MKAVFYQKIIPLGKLLKVGELDIPDYKLSYKFIVPRELKAYVNYEVPFEPVQRETIEYFRQPLIFEPNAYVAIINTIKTKE